MTKAEDQWDAGERDYKAERDMSKDKTAKLKKDLEREGPTFIVTKNASVADIMAVIDKLDGKS